ncbi:hypothetical protein ES705_24852 [subsurface metagenome]
MNNFAVLTIAYLHFTNAVLITITTNTPCHLTCYYTDKEPLSHRTSRNQRGLTLPWGVYYCFVGWLSLEQTEAGDTLIHTFEILDWSFCQTKWLAFRGTVAGELSPSVSPIFKHHHPGWELPEVLYNLDFEIWPDPAEYAHFWTPFWVDTGYGSWDREEVLVQHGLYSAKFTAGGYSHGRGFRQLQYVDPWRGLDLTFKAWARGSIHPMNRLTIWVDGTGGWLRHDSLTVSQTWQQLAVAGIIPDDATQVRIDVLGWSPGYGPTYTYFDNITVERN